MNVFTSTLATLFLLASLAQAYPSGAPKCTSLTPKHTGAKAKTSKSPYKIEATKANKDSAVVTISGGSGDKFKGFLLYATKPGSEDKIGTFKKVEKTSVMKCGSAGMATHTDNSDKTSVSLTWTAPDKFSGPVEFKATVVKELKEFWTGIKSKSITF